MVKKRKVKRKAKKSKKSKKRVKRSKKSKKSKKKTVKRPKPVKNPYILDEKAFEILKKAKLHIPKQIFCRKEKELMLIEKKVGYPCFLKISGKSIIKRSETNAMRKSNNYDHAVKFFKDIKKVKGADKVLIQEYIEGAELIIAISRNEDFGYVISVGIGGEYGKISKDVSFRIAPVDKNEIKKMFSELKAWGIIKSARRLNAEKLSEEVLKLSRFAINNKLTEIKIDPLICGKENCFVLDAKIIL